MSNQLAFKDHILETITHNDKIWFTAKTLATALKYSRGDKITGIYNRNKFEFSQGMTENLKLRVSGNYIKTVRLFSLRGAHLIAMFARTPVAEEFRKWVLDILDKEVGEAPIIIKPNREVLPKGIYHCKSNCNPYRACTWNGKKMIQIGVFPTIAEAVAAQKQFTATGETKRIQKPRINKTEPASISNSFTKADTFAHISMFLETAQMLSFYPCGKSLSLDLLTFVQEEAFRQSH